jgi:hypothetical protein
MKISQLIEKLEEFKSRLGDAEVLVEERGFGGYAMHTVRNVSEDGLCGGSIEDRPDDSILKDIFPEWDGDQDTLDDQEIKCVSLSTGTLLYAT